MDDERARGRASEYAQLALALMEDLGIPPHPKNFTVWYKYFSGADPELKRTLDGLLNSDTEFTEDHTADVFSKYCADPGDLAPLREVAQQIEVQLGTVMTVIDEAGEGTAAYGQSLESASGALAVEMPADRLAKLVSSLLNETRSMVDQGRELERRLKESAREIQELHGKLESSRKEALVDALTGLANRKRFDSVLEANTRAATDGPNPLSLLFLDVDHFKKFNDTYGHQVGDQVLKLLASILQKNIREGDLAARYGGEEFAVILPGAQLSEASQLAERIRKIVGARSLIERKSGNTLGQVTVSVGVAQFIAGEPPPELIERADKALYEAKRSGRNRVVVCSQQPHPRSAVLAS